VNAGTDAPGGSRAGLTPRDVVDFALKRHAVLTEVRSGRARPAEVCDAQAYLKLAARHYGELTGTACPVCDGPGLRRVHYVYGDNLGTVAGQAKHASELAGLADRVEEFRVYLVEVCNDCGWNHLIRTFVLGHGRAPGRRMKSAADG
jgi:hypothetical protein